MTPDQCSFIETELLQLTLGAVTQRGRVYQPSLSEAQRRPVHDTLRRLLSELSDEYEKGPVGDARHMENIEHVADTLTQRHSAVLRDGRLRIGSAQKALNLHLKYRWCLGQIPAPPHCPFDAYVLRAIADWRARSWTAIDTIAQYADLVGAARKTARGQPLPEWELSLYNAATNSSPSSVRHHPVHDPAGKPDLRK